MAPLLKLLDVTSLVGGSCSYCILLVPLFEDTSWLGDVLRSKILDMVLLFFYYIFNFFMAREAISSLLTDPPANTSPEPDGPSLDCTLSASAFLT